MKEWKNEWINKIEWINVCKRACTCPCKHVCTYTQTSAASERPCWGIRQIIPNTNSTNAKLCLPLSHFFFWSTPSHQHRYNTDTLGFNTNNTSTPTDSKSYQEVEPKFEQYWRSFVIVYIFRNIRTWRQAIVIFQTYIARELLTYARKTPQGIREWYITHEIVLFEALSLWIRRWLQL